MRWSLSSLMAAVLALTTTVVDQGSQRQPGLVRLLRATLPSPTRDRDHVLHRIAWRRRHRAVATTCHRQRHRRRDQP
ncbi:hypothetical protein [Streptomyces sp. NPDC058572]|uniref:hypothetical protein n=1 Tax=Streptomyces sp. NPDC058572 TaxID=3346546 RepID=UPI00364F5F46